MRVRLTEDEGQFLVSTQILPTRLLSKLAKQGNAYLVEVSPDEADQIRDLCGEHLQKEGFDQNYEPTSAGRILESLIDKFYVG